MEDWILKRKLLTITIFLVTFLFAGSMVYAAELDRRAYAYYPEKSETADPEQPTEAAPTDSGDPSEPEPQNQ